MLPLVAWRGASAVNVLLFNDIFAALAVVFIFLMLEAMREQGWSALHWKENATLALFAGFSSALYYLTTQPLVNLVSQVYAMAFLSLSLWLAFDNRLKGKMTGAFLAGSGLAIAILARPNMVFAWLLIVAIQIDEFYHEGNKTTQDLIKWGLFSGIPIAASVALLFWYNWARFGSGFDFGYEYMLVAERLKSDLSIYGQFHPHFIWRNFFDNFLRLPYLDAQCQKITPMPQGMSIFITSPLLIYLYRTFKKKIWVIGAWISISLIFITHILYYNSGALQYGYRFSLDFMPILVALLAFGFKKRIPRTGYILVIIGIAINIIGVLWSTHRWCINF